MKKNKILIRVIIIIAIVLTLAFIYSNSLKDVDSSSEQSGTVYDVVKPALDTVFGKDNFTQNEFRKSAHFFEFMVLGVEISLLILNIKGKKIDYLIFAVPFGFMFAGIDEIVQKFSSRGSMFTDVLIDLGGFSFSVMTVMAIVGICITLKNKGKNIDSEK